MALRRWRGGTLGVAQVDVVTVNTISIGDVFSLTINRKTVEFETPTTDASDVYAGLLEAIQAAVTSGQVPEFPTATENPGGGIRLTGDASGRPFVVTGDVDGDGNIIITPTIAPTGPNHWSEALNWEEESVPANGDDVLLENSAVPILYGLAQSAVTLDSLIIRANYTGTVGLPSVHQDGFIEYLPTYLHINSDLIEIGQGEGNGSERIRIDTGATETAVTVHGTSLPQDQAAYAVNLRGGHADSLLKVYQGRVAVAQFGGESAQFAAIEVGYVDDRDSDAVVFLGDDVTVDDIIKHGGEMVVSGLSGGSPEILQTAGLLVINGTDAVDGLIIQGGDVYYRTNGTLGGNTVVSGGGLLSFEGDLRTKTVTNEITVQGDAAEVVDPAGVVSGLEITFESTTRFPNLGTTFTILRS